MKYILRKRKVLVVNPEKISVRSLETIINLTRRAVVYDYSLDKAFEVRKVE